MAMAAETTCGRWHFRIEPWHATSQSTSGSAPRCASSIEAALRHWPPGCVSTCEGPSGMSHGWRARPMGDAAIALEIGGDGPLQASSALPSTLRRRCYCCEVPCQTRPHIRTALNPSLPLRRSSLHLCSRLCAAVLVPCPRARQRRPPTLFEPAVCDSTQTTQTTPTSATPSPPRLRTRRRHPSHA